MDTPTSLMNERLNTLCDSMGNMAQEMAKMRECMGGLRADVAWIKKTYWWLATVAGAALAAAIASVFIG